MRKLIFLILFLFSFSTSTLYSFNFLNNRVFKCRKNNYGFEELYKNAKNGVVVVKTPKGSGSGIVIKHHKNLTYIITNSHVVDKYKRVAIVWSNKEVDGGYVLSNGLIPREKDISESFKNENNLSKDLALIVLKGTKGTSLEFDKNNPPIGREVITVGSPSGLDYTITRGIISGIRSEGEIIQTDAAINEGNSGGPLLSLNGCIIGINTFKISDKEGLNFAISRKAFDNFAEKFPLDSDIVNIVSKVDLSKKSIAKFYLGDKTKGLPPFYDDRFKWDYYKFGTPAFIKEIELEIIRDLDFALLFDKDNPDIYLISAPFKAAIAHTYQHFDSPMNKWMEGFRELALYDLNKLEELKPSSLTPYFYKYKYIYSDRGRTYTPPFYEKYKQKKKYYFEKIKNKEATDHNDFYYKAFVFYKDRDFKKALLNINMALDLYPNRSLYNYLKSKVSRDLDESLLAIDKAILYATPQSEVAFFEQKYNLFKYRYKDEARALEFAKSIKGKLKNASRFYGDLLPFLFGISMDAEKLRDMKFACELIKIRYEKGEHSIDLKRYQSNSCSLYLR